MRLLLDTHVLLWWLADDPALSPRTISVVGSERDVYVSAASAWEVAIKQALGKLEAPDDLAGAVAACAFRELPVGFEHAALAGALPRHHDDPFDRMLVAQARLEGLTIVTGDTRFARYGVPVLAAAS